MEKKSAYTNLAKWFEYLNDDCDYEKWLQSLLAKLKNYDLRTGLDVGCGGGWFTRALQKHGYAMTGMDISPEMLDFAQEKSIAEGVRSEYILGDISAKRLSRRFDFVTAINDCVNYIPKTRLKKAFTNVAASLKAGGVFLFDVSSPRKFERKIANTVSVDDRDDVTYLSFNRLEKDVATMEVTLFCRRKDGAYERTDETHTQFVYTPEEIESALKASGFTLVEKSGHLGADTASADRLVFLAVKGERA